MKVYIEQQVHWRIEYFYENALLRHEALDEVTVMKKVHRLYDFAYQIYTLEDGTEIVRIHDAVHSLLYV